MWMCQNDQLPALRSLTPIKDSSFTESRGKNGELRVGIRRATNLLNNASTSVISGHSMQHGILASAFHAMSTGTMFSVYYRPWTSPAEFIIPFDHYMKSAEIDYSIGTRFKMQFEGEECAEKRYGGTVVGIEVVDPIRWPESGWRSLKVNWDATSDAVVRPERVSPWDIEPIDFTDITSNSDKLPQKRPRPSDLSTHTLPYFVEEDLKQNAIIFGSQSGSGVLQGQESAVAGINIVDVPKPPSMLNMVSPSNPDGNHKNIGLENQLHSAVQDSLYCYQGSKVPFTGGNTADVDLSIHWLPTFISYGLVNTVVSCNSSVANSSSHDQRALELKDANEVQIAQLNGGSRCMVFGVNLHSPPELPSPQVATSSERESLCSVPPMSQSSVSEGIQLSERSKSVSLIGPRKQCNNCCFVTNRSRIKVQKCGTVLRRSVDLSLFEGYDELVCELDHLFDFKGSLIEGTSGWHVTYMDNEGEMMLLGDYPWQDFGFMARRLIIRLKEDNDERNLNSPDTVPME
ncbi:auxin response factor 24-like [Tripterygium wilfordii]|nr:auxin response factor 24-like [Tripterygium wilfordii]